MKTIIPLARDTDVITSHEAADKMVKSGALNRQETKVYKAITDYEFFVKTFTTKELANFMNWQSQIPYHKAYDICRKRFSGLYNKGKIERLNTKGESYKQGDELMRRDGCAVWRLK